MALTDYIHQVLDYCLSTVKLVQNRQIGWRTANRKNGQPGREQQPVYKKLKLLILFSRFVEWVDTTKAMRLWIHEKSIKEGKEEGTSTSASRIKPFVDFYNINMDDFEPSDISKYSTFEDFFVRKHKPGRRPIVEQDDPTKAVVVADFRLVVYSTVKETQELWIKGHNFTIANLIKDSERAKFWNDGAIGSFRLSPQDYHRYHSPVAGTVSWYKSIPGEYYQVDPYRRRPVELPGRHASSPPQPTHGRAKAGIDRPRSPPPSPAHISGVGGRKGSFTPPSGRVGSL